MKLSIKFFVTFILLISILTTGCEQAMEQPADSPEEQDAEKLSDEELLEQYPDHLDEALQELEEVE